MVSLLTIPRKVMKNKKIKINLTGTKYEVIRHIAKEIF